MTLPLINDIIISQGIRASVYFIIMSSWPQLLVKRRNYEWYLTACAMIIAHSLSICGECAFLICLLCDDENVVRPQYNLIFHLTANVAIKSDNSLPYMCIWVCYGHILPISRVDFLMFFIKKYYNCRFCTKCIFCYIRFYIIRNFYWRCSVDERRLFYWAKVA